MNEIPLSTKIVFVYGVMYVNTSDRKRDRERERGREREGEREGENC